MTFLEIIPLLKKKEKGWIKGLKFIKKRFLNQNKSYTNVEVHLRKAKYGFYIFSEQGEPEPDFCFTLTQIESNKKKKVNGNFSIRKNKN